MNEIGVDECAQSAGCEARREYWPAVNFRLSPEDREQLEASAKQRRISVSAVIRLALADAGVLKPSQAQA